MTSDGPKPEDAVRQVRTDSYSYVFTPYTEPIVSVRLGEFVDVLTEDAFESRIQSEDDLPSKRC